MTAREAQTLSVSLVPDGSFERVSAEVVEAVASFVSLDLKGFPGLSDRIRERLVDLPKRIWHGVFCGDLRATAGTSEFDISCGLKLLPADVDFLAALRTRDVEAVCRHLNSPSSVGREAADDSESGARDKRAPGKHSEGEG